MLNAADGPLPVGVGSSSLLAWYRCSEQLGNLARDSSGLGNSARLTGDASWGFDELVLAGGYAETAGTSACRSTFTVASWIAPADAGAATFFRHGDRFGVGISPKGWPTLTLTGWGALPAPEADGPVAAGGDAWHHLAVVVDGAAGEVTCYWQGQPLSVAALPAGAAAMLDGPGSSPLRLGPGQGETYRGKLNDLLYFQRALGPEEIAGLAAAPRLVPAQASHRFYRLETAVPGGGVFLYFLLDPKQPADLQGPLPLFELLSPAGWQERPGHLVFTAGEPPHLVDLAARLDRQLPKLDPTRAGAAPRLVWIADPEVAQGKVASVPLIWAGGQGRSAALQLAADLTRSASPGDFAWNVPGGTRLIVRSNETRARLRYPNDAPPVVTVPAPTPGLSQPLHALADDGMLALDGTAAGSLRHTLVVAKAEWASLAIGFRFFVRDWRGLQVHRFDLLPADGGSLPASTACQLAFFPGSLDPAYTRLALPPDLPLTTSYRLVEGAPLTLVTTTNSRLAFTPYAAAFRQSATVGSGHLAPDGAFEVQGIGSDRHLLAGLQGTESMAIGDGDQVEFAAGQPALSRILAPDAGGGVRHTTRAQGGYYGDLGATLFVQGRFLRFTTSWLRIGRGGVPAAYGTQPDRAPHFGAPVGAALVHRRELFAGTRDFLPVVPHAGAAGGTAAAELEQHAIAPRRRAGLIDPASIDVHTSAGAAQRYVTTAQGLRLGLDGLGDDAKWCEVVLAQSPGANSPADAGTVRWTRLRDGVWRLLSHNEVFALVSIRGGAFEVKGSLNLSGFLFDLGLAADAAEVAAQAAPTLMVIKLARGKLADLLQDEARWAEAAAFNGDRAAAEVVAQAIAAELDQAAASSQPALYAHLLRVAADPAWTGLIVFNAKIRQAPAALESLLDGLPGGGSFAARHVVIPISRVHGAALEQADSAIFALIDYEGLRDGRLQLLTDNSGRTPLPADSAFDLGVPFLRAQFENAQLRHFECQAALGIRRLFGMPLQLGPPQGPAPPPGLASFLLLQGSYQTAAQTDPGKSAGTFAFRYRGGARLTVAGQDTLAAIDVDKVTMTGVRAEIADDESSSSSVARFSLAGALEFAAPASAGEIDVLGYQTLPFSELGVLKTVAVSERLAPRPKVAVDWAVDTARTAFDAAKAKVRGGLLADLPLKLKAFQATGLADYALADHGYQPVQLPLRRRGTSVRYAFLYQLDLGRPGALAPNARPLTAWLLAGWTPGRGVAVGLRIEGLRSDLSLTLEGALRLEIGDFALKKLGADHRLTSLILQSCRLGLFGRAFPPAPLSFDLVLQGVAGQDGVVWAGRFPTLTT